MCTRTIQSRMEDANSKETDLHDVALCFFLHSLFVLIYSPHHSSLLLGSSFVACDTFCEEVHSWPRIVAVDCGRLASAKNNKFAGRAFVPCFSFCLFEQHPPQLSSDPIFRPHSRVPSYPLALNGSSLLYLAWQPFFPGLARARPSEGEPFFSL